MRLLLAGLLLSFAVACSEETLTGAHAEFQATITFPGSGVQTEQTVDARERPEVTAISVACGRLVPSLSHVSVVSHDGGADGDPFTLTATLLDGGAETPLLVWNGTLDSGGRQTSFDRAESGFQDGAEAVLATILARPDPSYTVRYRLTSATPASTTTVRVVQYLEFATDSAECPPL